MLNYRQTAVTYSVYTVWQYNPLQNVHHKLQGNCSVSMQQEYFIQLFTHGVLYIKVMLVKLNHKQIPGLSTTLNFNSQDFQGPNSFSRTFQILEILGKNPGISRKCGNCVITKSDDSKEYSPVSHGTIRWFHNESFATFSSPLAF